MGEHFPPARPQQRHRTGIVLGGGGAPRSADPGKNFDRFEALMASGRPIILRLHTFSASTPAVSPWPGRRGQHTPPKSNPVFDRLLLRGRKRFGDQAHFPQRRNPQPTVRALRSGRPFYLPTSMHDAGMPFFAPFSALRQQPSADCPGWLRRMTGAVIMPCLTRMLPGGGLRSQFRTAGRLSGKKTWPPIRPG